MRPRDSSASAVASFLPCPRCGTRDTWEVRQPAGYRALLAAIDTAPSRAALARLGQALYARRLPRGQAGVAWGRYRIRRAWLQAEARCGTVRPLRPARSA